MDRSDGFNDADHSSFVNDPSENVAHKYLNEHLDDVSAPSEENLELLLQPNELELSYSINIFVKWEGI